MAAPPHRRGPDLEVRPEEPVPEGAVEALLASLAACGTGPLRPPPEALLDPAVARAQARRFKLDVSFRLGVDGAAHARWSLNDKGEPGAFRERLRATLPALGLPARALDAFLALSPPGEVQTTVSFKWTAEGGAPARVGLYFEELMGCPRALALREATLGLAGLAAPPMVPGALPAAVSVDLTPEGFIGGRDYLLCQDGPRGEQPGLALPPAGQGFREGLPLHPQSGARRFLFARRAGRRAGAKLLWVSEAHHVTTMRAAWGVVDAMAARLDLPDSAPARALRALRAAWPHAPERAYLYPDLVSLDLDGGGRVEALTPYVSIK